MLLRRTQLQLTQAAPITDVFLFRELAVVIAVHHLEVTAELAGVGDESLFVAVDLSPSRVITCEAQGPDHTGARTQLRRQRAKRYAHEIFHVSHPGQQGRLMVYLYLGFRTILAEVKR